MTAFAQLPMETISIIMNHLKQKDLYTCALVNHSFHAAVTPLLWHSVRLRNHLTVAQLQHFLATLSSSHHQVGHHIHRLRFRDTSLFWTDTTLMRLLDHLPSLQHLELLNATQITDSSIHHLAQQCPHLQSLLLDRIPITHHAMIAMGQHCHHLRHLRLYTCRHLSPSHLFEALAACPLEKLVASVGFDALLAPDAVTSTVQGLTGLNRLTHLDLCHVSPEVMHQLAQTTAGTPVWPHLTMLALTGAGERRDDTMMDDAMTQLIRQSSLGPLTELHLIGLGISDTTLAAIASSSLALSLIELDVNSHPHVTACGFRRVVLACPYLTVVNLEWCGVQPDDFPEIRNPCLDWEGGVQLLDQTAIHDIRQHHGLGSSNGSNGGDENNNNNNS